MDKHAFLRGFARTLKGFADDIARVSRAAEKGQFTIKHDATPEIKKFVSSELDKLKNEVAQKLDKTIRPKHLGMAAVGGGVGMGVGSALTTKLLPESRSERDDFQKGFQRGLPGGASGVSPFQAVSSGGTYGREGTF